MRSQNRPDLTLIVSGNTSREHTWILDPQGRNTFKIIVICTPTRRPDQPA
jgi:hypothetical protein